MAERLTRLSGLFLYVNAHKQHNQDKTAFKTYYPLAQKDFQKLSFEKRNFWNKVAASMSSSNDWLFFHGCDTALKCLPCDDKLMRRQLLDFRNFACINLYFVCKDIFEQQ